MSPNEEKESHDLWKPSDADAPFEVKVLQKAICKKCGRAGEKLYHRHCDDPADRPEPATDAKAQAQERQEFSQGLARNRAKTKFENAARDYAESGLTVTDLIHDMHLAVDAAKKDVFK